MFKKVIELAIKILETKGWNQGLSEDMKTGALCMMEAIDRARIAIAPEMDYEDFSSVFALELETEPTLWNDFQAKSFAQVKQVMKRVARAAQ